MTKKKPIAKRAKPRKSAAQNYRATLRILGVKFVGAGTSITDAIAAIAPGRVKGRGILIVENLKTGMMKDRILMPNQAFRLFGASGLMREIALKQVSLLFDL